MIAKAVQIDDTDQPPPAPRTPSGLPLIRRYIRIWLPHREFLRIVLSD
ncbi:MAG: hypothetical protein OXI18_06235 [bacterium]|nr:hypothetical protein [bacterium]